MSKDQTIFEIKQLIFTISLNKGYVSESGILSSSTIDKPKSQETPFDVLNKINQDSEAEKSETKDESAKKKRKLFVIPVDQKKIESGGTLSFSIPIDKVKESNIAAIISDNKGGNIVRLELSKCCGKLIDLSTDNYDVFLYPEELVSSNSAEVILTWISSVYSLRLKSSNKLISIIPTENDSIPHQAILLNPSIGEELNGNWSYNTGVRNSNTVSCTINKLDDRCKSTSVIVSQMIKPDLEFLRFGFIFSKTALSPFEMTISQNSNRLATLQITSNTIRISSDGNVSEVNLSRELKTGEWVSGDIFMVSSGIHNVIQEDSAIKCNSYSDSCVNSQNSHNWMSIHCGSSILRYAYLKKQAVENQAHMNAENTSNSRTPSSASEYYLYISFKNCIFAKLKVNANSFNKASVSDKRGAVGLAYWRLKKGISTSVNIPTVELDSIKENITKEINANAENN